MDARCAYDMFQHEANGLKLRVCNEFDRARSSGEMGFGKRACINDQNISSKTRANIFASV